MKTTCTIKWHDGQEATAVVENKTFIDEDKVLFSGDLSRLDGYEEWKTASSEALESFCSNLARRTHGVLTVTRDGEFADFEVLIGPDGKELR